MTLFSTTSYEEPDPGPFYSLVRISIDSYMSLPEEIGFDIEFDQCGGVVFADNGEKLRGIRRAYEGYKAYGVPVEWLEPDQVQACEPAFHFRRNLGGVFCPLNGYVNPLMATRGFAHEARRLGTTFLLGNTVQGRPFAIRDA